MTDVSKKTISFVIPTYRNAGTIPSLCRDIETLFDTLGKYNYEVIFINDGSDDDTVAVLQEIRRAESRVKYISFIRNFGQVAAIEAGLDFANGNAVIVLSADLQEPVKLAGEMIKKWEEGNLVVLANRDKRSDSLADKFFSAMFYSLVKLSNPAMPKGGFDFCLFDKSVHDQLKTVQYRNRFLQGDLLFYGHQIALIPYERKAMPGQNGSLRNLSFKIKYFFDGILNTTALPIRIMSLLGVLFTTLGFLYSLVIFINWLQGKTPFEGWAPIMIAILIIGGILMLILGVLGEYIWRIYDELKRMPRYIIRDKEVD